ncbi:MAG: hypothetical protein ACRENG_11540, partial [bacterium]
MSIAESNVSCPDTQFNPYVSGIKRLLRNHSKIRKSLSAHRNGNPTEVKNTQIKNPHGFFPKLF